MDTLETYEKDGTVRNWTWDGERWNAMDDPPVGCLPDQTTEAKQTPLERWEQGMPHHPESIRIYEMLKKADGEYGDDYFCWKDGLRS